jgi:hypothetical protein
MNFEEIRSILLSGESEQIRKLATTILQCKNLSELQELSMNSNEFIRLVGKLSPANGADDLYRTEALLAANLINQVSLGGCFCASYKTMGFSPEHRGEDGSISILSVEIDHEKYESYYICECTQCKARYRVECIEQNYRPRTIWKRIG